MVQGPGPASGCLPGGGRPGQPPPGPVGTPGEGGPPLAGTGGAGRRRPAGGGPLRADTGFASARTPVICRPCGDRPPVRSVTGDRAGRRLPVPHAVTAVRASVTGTEPHPASSEHPTRPPGHGSSRRPRDPAAARPPVPPRGSRPRGRAGRRAPPASCRGAEAWSVSWRRTVPPPRRSAATVARTEAGVASRRQSLPHAVHSTGRRPRRRATAQRPVVRMPYGGRYQRGVRPVVSRTTRTARRSSRVPRR